MTRRAPSHASRAKRPRRVFVYGTLQYPEVAAAVTGRRLEAVAARLHGYARYQVRGEPYPGIVPGPSSVSGLLYEGIDANVIQRIDEFEGPMYRRETLPVIRLDTGAAIDAATYVVRARWRPRLRNRDWDVATFERDWLAAYAGRADPRRHRRG